MTKPQGLASSGAVATKPDADSNGPSLRVFIKTYGCQMNVYDSERIAELLKGVGYAPTLELEAADLVVLNTCHIREKATEKVFSELGRLKALKARKSASGRG
jgi:tRNA-2-methylthio-N6-dimethylallyladenosine synthase